MRLATPLYVVWEATLDCNARCVHCYSDAAFGRAAVRGLSTEDSLRLIDELAAAGVLILAFSGGEFLLREDWPVLMARARERGMRVSTSTNGRAVSVGVARQLRDLGAENVSVSLDGADAATHDAIRGVPGQFDAACIAVSRLVAAGVRTTVNFTPMRANHQQAIPVIDLSESLGANKVNLTEYVYLSRGGLELMLDPWQLRDVVERWIAAGRERAGRIEVDWHDCRVALLLPAEEAARYQGCGAGYTHCRITVTGDVTPCVVLPNPVGNVLQTPFTSIWRDSPLLHALRTRDSIVEGNCASCAHKARCGGCRAISQAVHGHPFGGDDTCWITPPPGAPPDPREELR